MLIRTLTTTRAMQAYQLMRAGAGILTGMVLAKSMLSTAEIGIWEALLFLGTLVIFTGVNGLLQGISPVYMLLEAEARKRFIFQVFMTFAAIGLALFLVFALFKIWLIPALTGLSDLPGYTWFALYLMLNIWTLPVEIVFLLQNRPLAIMVWGIVGFGGQMAVVSVPALLGWGLVAGLQGLFLLAFAKSIWVAFFIHRQGTPAMPDEHLRRYLKQSTPLALNSFTGNLISLFDGWITGQWYSNPAIFAIYRYGSREFPWATALSTALGTASVPGIAAHTDKGIADLRARTTRLLHAVMPATILLMAFTPRLFPWVFSPAFEAAAPLFQIYLLVTLSRVLLPNSILIGLGHTRIIFRTGLGELALKIVTGWLFIQWWGLAGVGWSVVVSFWFEKLVLGAYLWYRAGIHPGQWLPLRWYMLYATLLILTFLYFWTPG